MEGLCKKKYGRIFAENLLKIQVQVAMISTAFFCLLWFEVTHLFGSPAFRFLIFWSSLVSGASSIWQPSF